MTTGLSIFDVLCLGIVLLSCLIGCWRGMASETLALLAWVGVFFAAQWGSVLVGALWSWSWLVDNPKTLHLLNFVLVFIATLLTLGLCASAARAGMKKTGLRTFDRLLGTGFGLLRAILLLWAVTVVIWLTPLHKMSWWQTSCSAPWLPTSLQQWLPPTLRSNATIDEYSSVIS